MTRKETFLTGCALAIACPLLTFVGCWWGSAAVAMYVAAIPERVIAAVALAGLGAGLLLDVLFLKRWLALFYTANWIWVAAVYLALFAIALAFFMGLPVGTFAVGVLGGGYLGRRLRHAHADSQVVSRVLVGGAFGAAALTTLLALWFGLMALHEPMVERAARVVGWEPETVHGPAGQASVVMICLLLFALQFWSTKAIGLWTWGGGGSAASLGADSSGARTANKVGALPSG